MVEESPRDRTTVGGVILICCAPPCQEELEELAAVDLKGDDEVPPCRARKRQPHVHTLDVPHNRNPKQMGLCPRTEN